MVEFNKNAIGNIDGNHNIVIQFINTRGEEVTEKLGEILNRNSKSLNKEIISLQKEIKILESRFKDKETINNYQKQEIKLLKNDLKEKTNLLEERHQKEIKVILDINGKDLREIDQPFGKAYEQFMKGNSSSALRILDRAKLLDRKKSREKELKEDIKAWQLRLTLIESSNKYHQEELDECYEILCELEPSWNNLIKAATHFLKSNDFKKTKYFCNQAGKKIKYQFELAFTLGRLGMLQTENLEFKSASKNLKSALKIYKRLNKENNKYEADLAVTYSHLGILNHMLFKHKKAEMFFNIATSIQEKIANKEDKNGEYSLAMTLTNMANLQMDINTFEEAEKYYSKALTILRKLERETEGFYLPDIATNCNNFASLYLWKAENFDKANELIDEAIKIRKRLAKLMPREFLPLLTASLLIKRSIFAFKNKPKDEEKILEKVINIQTRIKNYGPKFKMAHEITKVLRVEFHRIEVIKKEVNNIFNKDLQNSSSDEFHRDDYELAMNLVLILKKESNNFGLDKNFIRETQSLEITKSLCSKLNKNEKLYKYNFIITIYEELLNIYSERVELKHHSIASQQLIKFLEKKRKIFGVDERAKIATIYENRAFINKGAKTILYLKKSKKIRNSLSKENFEKNAPDLINTLSMLGIEYDSFGNPFASYKYLKKSYLLAKTLSQIDQKNIDYLGDTAHKLAILYSKIYLYKKAKNKFEEALDIRRKLSEKNRSKNETALALTLYCKNKYSLKHFDIHNSQELAIAEMSEAYKIFSKHARNSEYYERYRNLTKNALIVLKGKPCR